MKFSLALIAASFSLGFVFTHSVAAQDTTTEEESSEVVESPRLGETESPQLGEIESPQPEEVESPQPEEVESPQPSAGGVVTLSTTVKGNQEHPSVTYIVPWRQASDEEGVKMSFRTKTQLQDVFEHVERSEHERQVEFLAQMLEVKSEELTSELE